MPDGATPPATLAPAPSPAAPVASTRPSLWVRHLWHLVPVLMLSVLAAYVLWRALPPTRPDRALFDAAYLLTIALMAHGAWHSVLGFALTLLPRRFGARPCELRSGPPSGQARTAVLVPIFGEDPGRVAAAVLVMRRSLATVRAGRIDLFVLSDTRSDDHAQAERAALAAMPADGVAVHYRRRGDNRRRKAGNIAEWCERWGGGYDFMVVLDADSLISGDVVARLIGTMEHHSRVGMIQTMCWPVGRTSLFARVLQSGSRLHSSLSARGLAFWQGSRGAWWGHNAIIRTAAFMRHCGLPILPGRAPLGGDILCHDTVEAALMTRAGWGVWLVTDTEGSYEEVPTNLVDFLVRERRWCQGNLQHAGVLARTDGLPVASWLHLGGGLLHYATSPPLLLSAMAVLLWGGHTAAGAGASGPWLWGLTGLVLALMLVPKLLSLLLVTRTPGAVPHYGGLAGLLGTLLVEQVFAFLLWPVMLLYGVIFVTSTLAGRSVVWTALDRSDRGLAWSEAWRRLGWTSLVAASATAAVSAVANAPWFAWAVLPGLLLAVPFAVVTSRPGWGRAAARLGLFVTPDETAPGPELVALHAAAVAAPAWSGTTGLDELPPETPGDMRHPSSFRATHRQPAAALPDAAAS